MRRSKLGDLYSVKVPNGYKLFQRAYDIPREGHFVRVFEGLYDSIPGNLTEIVAGPHSYIVSFYASRAYRIGLAQWHGNFPVPEEYPFPEYVLDLKVAYGNAWINVRRRDFTKHWLFKCVKQMADLPEEFKNLKAIVSGLPPCMVLYLFDINWSFDDLLRFAPVKPDGAPDYDAYKPYDDVVQELWQKDKDARAARKVFKARNASLAEQDDM